MKSNPSPSAPLNLCPPTGVTGTTLPDDLTEDEIALAHVQSWPKAGIPDSGAHLDSPVKDTPENEPVHCLCECGQVHPIGEDCPSPASPVESVGVPVDRALLDCIECLQRLPDVDGAFRVTCIQQAKSALASHAAKDAKIKALEGAARDALQMIQNLRADCENGKFLDRERISGGLFHHVSTLDAALALPCA